MIEITTKIYKEKYLGEKGVWVKVAGSCKCGKCDKHTRDIKDFISEKQFKIALKENTEKKNNKDIGILNCMISFLTNKVLLEVKSDCMNIFLDKRLYLLSYNTNSEVEIEEIVPKKVI